MRKSIIGIVPLVDEEKESYWMLPGYMKGVEAAGGIPIMLPLTDDKDTISTLVDMCDGLLFTGGHDVSPLIYGEKPKDTCGVPCIERDKMESILLEQAVEKDKPVLGICRGIQFINAALGGTLYQDLPTDKPSDTEHHQTPPYDKPVHRVDVIPDSPLHALTKAGELQVNSYHHQAVKTLSDKLKPMAYSEDGLVEAAYMPDKKFIWAFQWHPEFSYQTDKTSCDIFKEFIKSTAE